MIPLRFIIVFVICHSSFVIGFGQGQPLSTQNKRAEKLFYTAIDSYQAKNYDKALGELKKAIEQEPSFTEAYILQGDIYADNQRPEKAIDSYIAAIGTNRPFSPELYNILANTQLSVGRYADARLNYRRFLENDQLPEQKRQQAEKGIRSCDFAIQCVARPVPFEPINMGDSLNTKYDEYINAITADEEFLYFTRLNPVDEQTIDQNQNGEEDFYISRRTDSSWSKAVNLGPPINTHGNEGALCISPDGKYLFLRPVTGQRDMAGATSTGLIAWVIIGRCPKTWEQTSIHPSGIHSPPSLPMGKPCILQVPGPEVKAVLTSGKRNCNRTGSGVNRLTLEIRSIPGTKKWRHSSIQMIKHSIFPQKDIPAWESWIFFMPGKHGMANGTGR